MSPASAISPPAPATRLRPRGDRAAEDFEHRLLRSGKDPLSALRAMMVAAATARHQAALERQAAAADREAAATARQRSADERGYAGVDELTGMLRRGAGELALRAEIDRARRSIAPLVLAVIDVDRLKLVNDAKGHAAGDALLTDVAAAIGSTLRSYDVTVRWGGDEFVCVLSDVSLEAASDRVAEIQRGLQDRNPGASISVGLAELEEADDLASLIARADTALYAAKSRREPQPD